VEKRAGTGAAHTGAHEGAPSAQAIKQASSHAGAGAGSAAWAPRRCRSGRRRRSGWSEAGMGRKVERVEQRRETKLAEALPENLRLQLRH
jgi:hypothetical protein